MSNLKSRIDWEQVEQIVKEKIETLTTKELAERCDCSDATQKFKSIVHKYKTVGASISDDVRALVNARRLTTNEEMRMFATERNTQYYYIKRMVGKLRAPTNLETKKRKEYVCRVRTYLDDLHEFEVRHGHPASEFPKECCRQCRLSMKRNKN